MKLLLDQGLSRRTAELLRDAGIDATHVAEVGMEKSKDEEILQRGCNDTAVVVTMDADFHSLLAASEAKAPSVIRIRIERLKSDDAAALLQTVMTKTAEDLAKGAVVTVQPARIRVHLLPLTKAG